MTRWSNLHVAILRIKPGFLPNYLPAKEASGAARRLAYDDSKRLHKNMEGARVHFRKNR